MACNVTTDRRRGSRDPHRLAHRLCNRSHAAREWRRQPALRGPCQGATAVIGSCMLYRVSATAVCFALVAAGCIVEPCVELARLPPASDFRVGCSVPEDCIAIRSRGCGNGCDCDVVISSSERDRYSDNVLAPEICCTAEQEVASCDCAPAFPACADGVCLSDDPEN